MLKHKSSWCLAALAACGLAYGSLAAEGDSLQAGFEQPPASAKPRTWWHWLNGNVTLDGIDKDLDWLASVGIGGVQHFDASMGAPQIVDKRLAYMDPDWQAALRHAVATASEHGLEFAIAASPGWSETGGPWVEPRDGMKKLVWSETLIDGGKRFRGEIPAAPGVTGPYQAIPFADHWAGPDGSGNAAADKPGYYGDVAVLAYPVTKTALPSPTALSGMDEPINATALLDDDLASTVTLKSGEGDPVLLYQYPEAVTVRSATLFIPHARPPFGESRYLPVLEAETDAGWQPLATLPLTEVPTTVSFDAVSARRFRLVMAANTGPTDSGLGSGAPGAVEVNIFAGGEDKGVDIAHWSLSPEARINLAELKAGFALTLDYLDLDVGAQPERVTAPAQVLNLSDRLDENGGLDWTPPAGSQWRILRFGYSLTGKTNHPATPEATGLEVDKFDAAAVRRYLETYLGMYREAVGEELFGQQGLSALLTDSIEVGASNWTGDMAEKFRELRGYDPVPWLPVLTGAVIGSVEQSEAFLFDFRRTLGELLAREHYGTVAEVAAEQGLIVYGEALENARPVLGDDMALRARATVPMAALWNFSRDEQPRPTLLGDMKGAASVAHVYGQNLVAAESMTSAFSPWAFAPSDLKRLIDLEFAYGINRPVIHTSVHQPVDDKVPGLSLAVFGQYFNRHETWAGMAKPWIDYIARSSYLLQQGRYFADIAYFYGEETPLTAQFKHGEPGDLPTRHGYDFVNAEVIANLFAVDQGELVTPSGARYKVLYLGEGAGHVSLATLRHIERLAQQGATVVGSAPKLLPSLADDAGEFAALVQRLWSGQPMTMVGKGRVVDARDVEQVLADSGLAPDFAYSGGEADSEILFLHRRLADGDLYFVNNRRNRAQQVEARFRVTGKRPEIWRAIDGSVSPVSWRMEGDTTVIPLELGPEDAFFVVFRETTATGGKSVPAADQETVAVIDGPWRVSFQPGRGAPESVDMDKLIPLNRSETPGIRYFSGVATYTADFTLGRLPAEGRNLWLDLGAIGDVAEVVVNGQTAGISWFPPYRVPVGELLAAGENRVEIRVANLWVNRLIGDKQPGAETVTFTAAPTYQPDAPLRDSGLLGPVRLIAEKTATTGRQ